MQRGLKGIEIKCPLNASCIRKNSNLEEEFSVMISFHQVLIRHDFSFMEKIKPHLVNCSSDYGSG